MITFYDLSCKRIGCAWSPNTWKVRIPYKTQWVEFPDIRTLCESKGIPPSGKISSSGLPIYTLPAIHDPSTNTYLSNSPIIIKYLDYKYPHTPKAFPQGASALQTAFLSAFVPKVKPLWPIIVPTIAENLNPPSEAYFRRTREAMFGESVEDMSSEATTSDPTGNWEKFKANLGDVNRWLSKNDDVKGAFITGEDPIFVDFVVGGTLKWMRTILGEESQRWKEVASWHDGRWRNFTAALKEYEEVK